MRPVEGITELAAGVQTKPPIDRGSQIARRDRPIIGEGPLSVTSPIDGPAGYPAPRQERGVAIGPMVASTIVVDLWRAAKFAGRDNQCGSEQPVFIQIVDQRGQRLVSNR